MTTGFLFWLLMVLWLVMMVVFGHTVAALTLSWPVLGLWCLLGLLGWKVFGPAVHN